ncbi:hypothetical protein DCS_00075 [Drechmeria coniospora]|uniref:Spermatogenesis-associated protein 20-like TRX domain-containing protein n=1 Tax=Drechmeria coniospora TaxID=98403 RepID=A0A151GPE8_DRECN|nr:hypothetical protein DCS_00075 [Drechmeria coniospora]KYK58948.1 hypothetical protein DCS_00075 [Drechmeria coniospora]
MVRSEITASAATHRPVPAEGGIGGEASPLPPLQNRVGSSQSPFVRSAQGSSVKWQLLDDESVERAKRENKLIFIHVGYKACHFCRLMDVESFSNPECAAALNESFVPIIIDRDERPDVDTIYMNYVQAVSNVGGWPLNLFVTPNLEPVFGGTYWPGPGTTRRTGADGEDESPDFLTILRKVGDIWRDQESRCRKEATEVLSQLREFAAEGTLGTRGITSQQMLAPTGWAAMPSAKSAETRESKDADVASELDLDQLEEAYTHIAGTFDPVYGGFGLAPKFLTPSRLKFLLQLATFPDAVQDVVGEAECKHAADMAVVTLRKIRDGALHDHVGRSGFSRCSVTSDWNIPNFEKLVVDNALLLTLYLDAWRLAGASADGEFYDTIIELAECLTSPPIVLPAGGLATSEAADSLRRRDDRDKREGAYYLWTRREFDSVLDAADKSVSPVVAVLWDVRDDGNVEEDHDPNDDFINQNILRVVRSPQELGKQFGIPVETVERYISVAKRELRARREGERPAPELDDKIVAGWNGLAVSALAQTATALKELNPRQADKCLGTATAAVAFIKKHLWDDAARVLYRIWKDERATEGFADDYAYLIGGLLDLHEATGDASLVDFADALQRTQIKLFHDPTVGAFYSTTTSSPHTILRLKDGMDTSLPSTNGVSASNLFRLGALRNDEDYSSLARGTVDAFEAEMLQHPWLFPALLANVVTARLGFGGAPVRVKAPAEKA